MPSSGQRIEYDGRGIPEPCTFWRDSRNQQWGAVTPNGMMANLSAHDVTEQDDGTITVAPSIRVRGGRSNGEWHGYLERGQWREV